MKLNDLQSENLGSIIGVLFILLIIRIFWFEKILIALIVTMSAYMIVTQIQLSRATADNSRFNKLKKELPKT